MPLDTATGVRHLTRTDPVMRRIIKTIGPCGLKPGARGDHFTTLARSIVGQQMSAKAAETIWQRMCALYPNHRKLVPEEILATPAAKLRGAGLSGAKLSYIRDLAGHVSSGELRLDRMSRLSDERIIESLVAVNGIGVWTAEMFMLFKLGRPDVWPIGDLAIRNAVVKAYNVEPTKANLNLVAEPWRPWRSVASWYLWRSVSGPAV